MHIQLSTERENLGNVIAEGWGGNCTEVVTPGFVWGPDSFPNPRDDILLATYLSCFYRFFFLI